MPKGVVDQVGTLATGKLADVVAVEGDVLQAVETLESPANMRQVLVGGRAVAAGGRALAW